MEKATATWTLGSLAALLGGEALGPHDLILARPVSAGDEDPAGITFAENDTYLRKAEASGVGAVLIGHAMVSSKPAIRVEVPRLAFFHLLHLAHRPMSMNSGVHPTADVHRGAKIDGSASVGPFTVIGPDVQLGPNVRIHAHVAIGDRCEIGEGTVVYPRVSLYPDVRLGARCTIHSGAVIGADGFGFVWDGNSRIKVPQVGGVVIGDDVEIGANTCIDRATAGDTVIGSGTKLDNLIQIGHNCKIGKHVVIAGQCGISGSVSIGDRSSLGGGVVTRDHVSIAADVSIGGHSGVDRDIVEAGEYFGTPARPAREALRAFMLGPKLPELWSRLRKLEKRVGVEEE